MYERDTAKTVSETERAECTIDSGSGRRLIVGKHFGSKAFLALVVFVAASVPELLMFIGASLSELQLEEQPRGTQADPYKGQAIEN